MSTQVDELVAGYEAGQTLRELSAQSGLAKSTVLEHLRQRGVELRDKSPRKLTDEQIEEAARRYQAGESLTKLAPEFGVRRHTLAEALKRAGHEITPGKRSQRADESGFVSIA